MAALPGRAAVVAELWRSDSERSAGLISIVVPVLNEAGQVSEALQRLQGFRAAGHEVVLVDGGSSDATCEQARPYVDQLLNSRPGRAKQMNAGAASARGNILLFLHVDTELPDTARHQLESSAVKGRWGRFDVRLSPGHRMFPVIAFLMNVRSRLTGIATGDQCLFADKALFDRIGGFPDQPLMEDIELCRRLKCVQKPLCLRDKVITSSRRWQKNGVWRTIFLMWRFRLFYFLGRSPESLAAEYYPESASQAKDVTPKSR